MRKLVYLVVLCCVVSVSVIKAQDMPDVVGLNVPEATAKLHKAGFSLGTIGLRDWSSSAGEVDTVESQSLGANNTVDIVVWRAEKLVMIYDDEKITLYNPVSVDLSLRRVVFSAGIARFDFTTTDIANRVRADQCVQLWAEARSSGESVAECGSLQKWASRTVPEAHFWRTSSGDTTFEITQDGVPRGSCAISARRCEVYLTPAEGENFVPKDTTEYVYMTYSTNYLLVRNQTEDRWSPVGELRFGSVRLANTEWTLDTDGLLAPGECVLIQSRDESPPDNPGCEIVGTIRLAPVEVFWTAAFRVDNATEGRTRQCPAVTGGEMALCIIPRLSSPE